jgi:hypothetical protein
MGGAWTRGSGRSEATQEVLLALRRSSASDHGPAVDIVGNVKAFLQPRRQMDRALKEENRHPLDEGPSTATGTRRSTRWWSSGGLRAGKR